MYQCRHISHIKRFIALAAISSMFFAGFQFYQNPSKSPHVIRSVTLEMRPLDTHNGNAEHQSHDLTGHELVRRHDLDDPTSSSTDILAHQQSVDDDRNERQHEASNTELHQPNMNDSPSPPSQHQSMPRTSHVSPISPSADQRSDSGDQDVNPSSSENNQILSKHFNDKRENKFVQSQPAALDPAIPVGGSPNMDSQASSAPSSQQPSRYIPHRCPPGFDKITDQEYNNWFLKDVVQRSPVSVHSTSALNDEILILTPISNSAKHLQRYFENICSLVYPHRLVSIVLGEDSSTDTTVETAQQMTDQLGSYFQRVELVRLPLASSSL